MHSRLLDLEDRLHLDGDIIGECLEPDRRAGMNTLFPKDLVLELRCTVDDGGSVPETGCGVDHPQEFDDTPDTGEIT